MTWLDNFVEMALFISCLAHGDRVIFIFCLQPFGQIPVLEDGDVKIFGMHPSPVQLECYFTFRQDLLSACRYTK